MKLMLLALLAASVAFAQEPPPPAPAPAETQPAKNPAEKAPPSATDPEKKPEKTPEKAADKTPEKTVEKSAEKAPDKPAEKPKVPEQAKPEQPKAGPVPTEEFLAKETAKLKDAGITDAKDSDWKVHWEFSVMALPAKKALGMLSELRDETTIEAGWGKVQAMVESGEADVVASHGGQIMNETEVTSSQGEDVKYGIEFDTPFAIESAQMTRLATELENEKAVRNPGAPKTPPPAPIGYPTTTFETRKLGVMLKLKAAVSADGKRLEVTTKFDRTWLKQWDETEIGRLANNEKIVIKQPRFTTVNYEGTSGLFAGERILLSAHRVPVETGKMELVFLRMWTSPRKAAGK